MVRHVTESKVKQTPACVLEMWSPETRIQMEAPLKPPLATQIQNLTFNFLINLNIKFNIKN